MKDAREFLLSRAEGDLLPWSVQVLAAEMFHLSFHEVEETALRSGLLPARYQRNRKTFSIEQQLLFAQSKVAVIGCGGLGGYVIEELARLGVGLLTAVDPDVFEEHNLNRQLLSSPGALGRAKVEVAAERVEEINPSVQVVPVREALTRSNGPRLLEGSSVAVDALDTMPARLALADVCGSLGIPLVHGTIAGWYGQVLTQFPGEETMSMMYGQFVGEKGVEGRLGNPAFTPAVVASLQVAEVCKIIVTQGSTLRNRLLCVNLLDMVVEEVKLQQHQG
ncbi:MAG: HesA/MoeB/ThiF family protein [Chloroflexota bacterium]|jgi:molybdopterin-synthase adenylyltransferase